MPWNPSDATEHTKKATTPHLQRTWANAANNFLENCLKKGGDQSQCEAAAVRVGNAAVDREIQKQSEQPSEE